MTQPTEGIDSLRSRQQSYFVLLLVLILVSIVLPTDTLGLTSIVGERVAAFINALVLALLFIFVEAIVSRILVERAKRRAAELLDGDAVLVGRIVRALRPSLALAVANNAFWFIVGVAASIYSDQIKAFIEKVTG